MKYDEGEAWMSPHPIDALTPNVLAARRLWDTARANDVLSFLNTWERLMTDHDKEVEEASSEGESIMAYDDGYLDGKRHGKNEGYARGKEDGYTEGWKEAEEKLRSITGERPTQDS